MSIVAYCRTSSQEQSAGLTSQIERVKVAGAVKVFQEQVSSVKERGQLEAALAFLREGDVLICTSLDRLARSVVDLSAIVTRINGIGAKLKTLDLAVDTTTPQGTLIVNLMGSIAQFERQVMLDRQRVGIEAAKREGRYRGRAPTARRKAKQIVALAEQNVPGTQIAEQLGIGVSSVWRILKAERAKGA